MVAKQRQTLKLKKKQSSSSKIIDGSKTGGNWNR